MADDNDANNGQNNNDGAQGKAGGKLKRVIILALVALLIVGISVGGTLAALKVFQPEEPVALDDEAAQEAEPVKQPAIYYPVKPEIIVNYDARGRQRYVQAEVTLLIRDPAVISAIETHMPMVRDTLNRVIGGQVFQDIQTAEGKELMRQQCLQELRQLMEQEIGKPGIEQVLFTSLVMQ